jgi:hypothetical protein
MKSSSRSLIPFLPLFCNCQFRRLYSIQFEAHISACRLASQNSTLLDCSVNWILLCNNFVRTPRKTSSSIVPYCFRRVYRTIAYQRSRLGPYRKQPLCCWGVFTESLPSNGYPRHNSKIEYRNRVNAEPNLRLQLSDIEKKTTLRNENSKYVAN